MIKVVVGDREYILRDQALYTRLISKAYDQQTLNEQAKAGDLRAMFQARVTSKQRLVALLEAVALYIIFSKKIAGLPVRTHLKGETELTYDEIDKFVTKTYHK